MRRYLALTLVSLSSVSCGREPSQTTGGPAPAAAAGIASARPTSSASAAPTASDEPETAATAPTANAVQGRPSIPPDAPTTWDLGELADVAPAAPATAHARGIAVVTKEDELLWANVDAEGHFGHIDRPSTDFARYGRGPALTEKSAYWVNRRGEVMRASFDEKSSPARIAEKARSGARVSALRVGKRDLVAFVSEVDERSSSYLWTSTGELVPLTPDVSGATSVTLVPNGTTPLALTLEGRTSMSPVHAQQLRVAPQRVNVPSDQVIWVGPGAEPLTELAAVPTTQGKTLALLATAHTITDFGLGHFVVEPSPQIVSTVDWLPYPNGIDPAPVAAQTLCGAPYVFFARPSDSRPRSPQELRVARVDDGKVGDGEVIVRSRAFNDISVAPRPSGAVLSWTADHRTWAMTLGCSRK